jgi:hypothetical protein
MTTAPGPAQKLADLLETLDPADRKELTAWLLGRGTRAWSLHLGPDLLAGRELAEREVGSALTTGEGSQLVTVRLPAPQHERLREWCADHNFTMAAVVRGLIERFLDDQDRSAPR